MDATDTKNSTDTKTIKVVDANEESSLDNSEESKESFTDSEEIDSIDSSSEEEVDAVSYTHLTLPTNREV